jgi:hypothetical protein
MRHEQQERISQNHNYCGSNDFLQYLSIGESYSDGQRDKGHHMRLRLVGYLLNHHLLLFTTTTIRTTGFFGKRQPTTLLNMAKTRSRSTSTAAAAVKPKAVTKPKLAAAKKKTSKKESSSPIDDDENRPWYRKAFTKGDDEYDRYMGTEWGFEKVSFSSRL